MSSGPQSCRDDEDDWSDFQRANGIQHIKVNCYSEYSRNAVAVKQKYPGLTGEHLDKVVNLMQQITVAVRACDKDAKDYALYLTLKSKYEKQ
jgi:hypothetical protein